MESSHLVFFDGECGICDQAVQSILKLDKQRLFVFAPLNGETAAQYLKGLPAALTNSDSLILIENYRSKNSDSFIGSTAVFRICWLLGGWWSLPGLLFFLPSFLFNWGYRLFARFRHRFFPMQCLIRPPDQNDRFLP